MKVKNKVLLIVATILIAFVGFFSISLSSQSDLKVKADTGSGDVYSFSTSNIIYPLTLFNTINDVTSSTTSVEFVSLAFTFGLGSSYTTDSRGDYVTINFNGLYNNYNPIYFGALSRNNWTGYWVICHNKYVLINAFLPTDFNYNIDYVTIQPINNYVSGQSNLGGTEVLYHCTAGSSLRLQFPLRNDISTFNYIKLDYRRYYFIDSSSLTDNDYYNTGYDNGYSAGSDSGYDNGYSVGYSAGNNAGYNTGYNAGISDANTYSFLGLIGAAFDVPINAFITIFDFNVLGINMKDFFLSIITFAIIIFVVRLILGK